MKKMKNLLTMILLSLTMCVTSCDNSVGVPDKPAEPEVTLEDALNDGTVVAFTFNLNDEEFYVAFVRVGDTYELLDFDKAQTRAEEPVITEKDCEFSMVHDKDNNQIKFTVKEKKTSGLVLTAVIDIKQSTMEVTPGDPKYKIYLDRRSGERCKGGGVLLLGTKQNPNRLHFHQRRWNILLQDHWVQ